MNSVQILMMGNNKGGLGYGYLYNWYAASDALFAPTDWTVPNYAQLTTLITFLGGFTVAGGHMKETLFTHWNSPNTGADNSSGLTLWGAGWRNEFGNFTALLSNCLLWTNEAQTVDFGYYTGASATSAAANQISSVKERGQSIRLLYTGAGTPTTVTDEDGNVYDVVLIGTQRWIVQNWKCTKLNDGTPLTKITGDAAWAALTTEGYCAYDNDEGNV